MIQVEGKRINLGRFVDKNETASRFEGFALGTGEYAGTREKVSLWVGSLFDEENVPWMAGLTATDVSNDPEQEFREARVVLRGLGKSFLHQSASGYRH
jgi:hypothetical protein